MAEDSDGSENGETASMADIFLRNQRNNKSESLYWRGLDPEEVKGEVIRLAKLEDRLGTLLEQWVMVDGTKGKVARPFKPSNAEDLEEGMQVMKLNSRSGVYIYAEGPVNGGSVSGLGSADIIFDHQIDRNKGVYGGVVGMSVPNRLWINVHSDKNTQKQVEALCAKDKEVFYSVGMDLFISDEGGIEKTVLLPDSVIDSRPRLTSAEGMDVVRSEVAPGDIEMAGFVLTSFIKLVERRLKEKRAEKSEGEN